MRKNDQSTDTIMMIRPVQFRMNEQTAVNNYYQTTLKGQSADQLQNKALAEFDDFAKKLQTHGVNVLVINDTAEPSTPDSIFPNNWVSFHKEGSIGLYPMFAENRRLERRLDILERLKEDFVVNEIVDFSEAEFDGRFLEGTGSMILDRQNKIVYAALSVRTQESVLDDFCEKFDYESVKFIAYQTVGEERLPIYHTNVMMCVADEYAILCADAIDDQAERTAVITKLESTGKEVIQISEEQNSQFAGNMLQVRSSDDQRYLVMSGSAFRSLTEEQIERIENYNPIIHSDIDTIETLGGGSARCMMAEVFLPKK